MRFKYKCQSADEQEWMFKKILSKNPEMDYHYVHNFGGNFNLIHSHTKESHFDRWPYILWDNGVLAASRIGDTIKTRYEFLKHFNIKVGATTIPPNGVKFIWPPK